MLKIENPCFVVFFKYSVENSTLLYIGYFVFFNFFLHLNKFLLDVESVKGLKLLSVGYSSILRGYTLKSIEEQTSAMDQIHVTLSCK